MHSLQHVHDMNAYRAGPASVSIRIFQQENQLIDSGNTSSAFCVIGGFSKLVLFCFPHSANTNMADSGICEMGATLATLKLCTVADLGRKMHYYKVYMCGYVCVCVCIKCKTKWLLNEIST
jgi:hypothetical protein